MLTLVACRRANPPVPTCSPVRSCMSSYSDSRSPRRACWREREHRSSQYQPSCSMLPFGLEHDNMGFKYEVISGDERRHSCGVVPASQLAERPEYTFGRSIRFVLAKGVVVLRRYRGVQEMAGWRGCMAPPSESGVKKKDGVSNATSQHHLSW